MAAVRSCCSCSILKLTLRCWRRAYISYLPSGYGIRKYSTEPLPMPTSDSSKTYPDHIESLVESISKLNLLEVSSLNELLKARLNIQDAPMMMAGAVAAPAAEAEEDEAPKEVQTEFSVKLLKFDDSKKVKLIKEIKAVMVDFNLVQAKKFVESLPQFVKEKLSKEDAEKLKLQLEAVGATVEVE